MCSSRTQPLCLPSRTGWPATLGARSLLAALLLGGCSDPPPDASGSGSSSTTDTTGPEPTPPTSSGSSSTGVADGTAGSGSTGSTGDPRDCCAAHSQPGCADLELLACVCDQEASCCAFGWDAACVDLAEKCGGCSAATGSTDGTTGGPDPACCSVIDQPGCADDPAIEACVCALDAFCCDVQWDDQCVQTAVRQCGAQCEIGGDGCCVPAGSPGCPEDPGVEACVCALDAFCCDEQWDGNCVELGQNDCGLECPTGDCCTAHDAPGCDDPAISNCVCALDGFCCDNQWDGLCVNEAQYACMAACGLPPGDMGDCCMEQPGPGCGDMVVTDCTCMVDGGCCLLPWDDHCIGVAVTACGIACEGVEPLPPCCFVQPGPGCADVGVEACVCGFDEFCCDVQWDGQCVEEAQMDCMLDCSGAAGGSSSTG
jgi:hypothetical protein